MHAVINSTLESIERENKKLLKSDYIEPKAGMGATLIGFWDQIPCTVVLVQERRMLVQEDTVQPDGSYARNPQGVLRGFVRQKNAKKWHYAADKQSGEKGRTLGILIGQRKYHQPDIQNEI